MPKPETPAPPAARYGMLLALEGIDGAGTTTQLQHLAAHLQQRQVPICCTAEPSQGAVGSLLRQCLRQQLQLNEASLALLFAADRLDHLQQCILPALQAGKIVLTDRYLLSSLAYQGSQLPQSWLLSLNAQARAPDLCIFLRVDPEVAAARRLARGGPPELFDATARQQRVAQCYEAALQQLPTNWGATHSLDANASRAAVGAALVTLVEGVLQQRGYLCTP